MVRNGIAAHSVVLMLPVCVYLIWCRGIAVMRCAVLVLPGHSMYVNIIIIINVLIQTSVVSIYFIFVLWVC